MKRDMQGDSEQDEMQIKVTEKSADGLARDLDVAIARPEFDAACDERLQSMQANLKLDGFREGKVPLTHVKRLYGAQVHKEVMEEMARTATQQILQERKWRPTLQPHLQLDEQLEARLKSEGDVHFGIQLELRPEVALGDFSQLVFERPVATPGEQDVAEALGALAVAQRRFVARLPGAKAEPGDKLVVDFQGTMDGKDMEGGKGEGVELILGESRMLPGFAEALAGCTAAESRTAKLRYPADHPQAEFAGKEAEFKIQVKSVLAPQVPALDAAFAKSLGMESMEQLRTAMAGRLKADAAAQGQQKLKQNVFASLVAAHKKLEAPPKMLAQEYDQLWESTQRRFAELEQKLSDKEEKTLQENCRRAAETRVRLALLISEIGAQKNIEVSDADMQKEMTSFAAQYPGREKEALEQLQKSPPMLERLRAQIFEDRVVEQLCQAGRVQDKPTPFAELMGQEAAAPPADASK